ncbi:MAG: protein kinase [Proteobacteria bacterium]|nr:protein kinase [Pseudomonadota bacterium]
MSRSHPIAALGAFDLYEPLGRGGMGVVYRATHRRLGLPVAVKLVVAADSRAERFRTSFRNEVRLAARLDHPHIVGVLDYGEATTPVGPHTEGTPWLVMERVMGGTLSRHLGQLPWEEVRQILLQLLDALAHAHARGVMHRDLKPGNVLLDEHGRPKLTDFGLAHALDARIDLPKGKRVLAGTPAYMAPEQFRANWTSYGPWTDLYSFGCLAWALVTGGPPFPKTRSLAAGATQHQLTEPPPLRTAVAVPPDFENWLRCLLEKEPGARFQRAADASWTLRQMGEASEPAALPRSEAQAALDESLATLSWTMLSTVSLDTAEADDFETDTASLSVGLAAPRWQAPPLPDTWRRARPRTPLRLRDAGLGLFGLRTIPLIDREPARDRLWQALRATYEDRQARAVVVSGAAGFGKTRLMRWLATRAHESGAAHVFDARHAEVPGSSDGVGPMFARFMRCADLDPDAAEARLKRILRGFGERDPAEATAVRDALAPDSATTVAADAERFGVWHRLLRHIGGPTQQPGERRRVVVLLFDDAQWAASALRFARHLLADAESSVAVLALLGVTTELLEKRPVESALVDDLLAMPRASKVELDRLSRADHAELVDALIGLAPERAVEVVERTAGNPLFAVQLVGEWVARGDLQPTERGYDLSSAAESMPTDLDAVWAARVERAMALWPEAATQCIELAAVLGDDVDAREWTALCDQAGVQRHTGVRDELIHLRLAHSDNPSDGWAFQHPRVRLALLDRATRAGRLARWHRAAVGALRHQAGGTPDRIGQHLIAAGEPELALRPLLEGVDRRMALADWSVAEALLAQHATALALLGLAADDPRVGRGWLIRARLALLLGKPDEAQELLDQILVHRQVPAWAEVVTRALRFAGRVLRRKGHLTEGRSLASASVDGARALGDPQLLAECLLDLGEVQVELGEIAPSAASTEEALQICTAREDVAGVARCEEQLGWLAQGAGDYRRARMLYDRAAAAWRALGQRWGEAQVRNISGDVTRYSGDLDAADALYLESERLYASVGAWSKIYPQYNRALVALESGAFDQAAARLDRVQPEFERLGHRAILADIALVRCALAVHARDGEVWDEELAKAKRLYEETQVTDEDSARVAELAARVADREGERERARGAWEIAAAQWRALGREKELAAVSARLEA